ncbi:receptor-like protein 4 [Phoenix dactylifera]|uniref:Receptor-like protein 4 n=1 Tax=Phoenix dactylifera TaxID=42345 RepID=A0A8B9AWH5_PHODC|nr:receptor-like protein 4 [Phoenix dactylifera]
MDVTLSSMQLRSLRLSQQSKRLWQKKEFEGHWSMFGLGFEMDLLCWCHPNNSADQPTNEDKNLCQELAQEIREKEPSQIGDLLYNQLNCSIPESLGQLTSLLILVPASLGGRPLHRASFNFTGNGGLCGIPGLRTCGPYPSVSAKVGIAFEALVAFLLVLGCLACWWKRRQNILGAQKIAAAREALYANRAKTRLTRDVQTIKHHHAHDQSRNPAESGSHLLN